MFDTISYLFKTNAIRFCEENKPFWYTSGKIGPYFINTHFVYGSEKDAVEFLSFIDECLNEKNTLPQKVFEKSLQQYQENEIYKDVINHMKSSIEDKINVNEIDYISGGERRDWFFSNIIAHLLKKPHISIYKDLSAVVSDYNFEKIETVFNLNGAKVLHIADLFNTASSYLRAWIPAIEKLNGKMKWSYVVVDRMQGAKQNLAQKGIKSYSLVDIDSSLLQQAHEMNILNENQVEMLNRYFENPDDTMKQFLISHPEFLKNALNSDEKTKKRANLLIDGNLYGLNK